MLIVCAPNKQLLNCVNNIDSVLIGSAVSISKYYFAMLD